MLSLWVRKSFLEYVFSHEISIYFLQPLMLLMWDFICIIWAFSDTFDHYMFFLLLSEYCLVWSIFFDWYSSLYILYTE